MLDNTHTHARAVADVPMRAWNKLLWKMSMTLWMERRSSRSSVHCSLDRYSSSSTRARCASERQQGETMNHITSHDERHTTQASSSSQPAQRPRDKVPVLRLGRCGFDAQSDASIKHQGSTGTQIAQCGISV